MLKRLLIPAIAAAAIIAASLAARAEPAHKMSWNEVRRGLFALSKVESASIVMLGDSLTEGAPWAELTGCPHLLERGVGGDTTAKVLARLDDVLKLKPRAVFLMIGVNDISLSVPRETTIANYKAILDRLKEPHLVVAYVLPVAASYGKRQMNGSIAALDDTIASLVADRPNTTVLDLRPRFRGPDGYLRAELSYDGLHLSPKGYELWRDAIAPYVAEYCVP
jgi:lysophospholipase L1-like esterase